MIELVKSESSPAYGGESLDKTVEQKEVGNSFGWAIERLKEGKRVKRIGWNGKNMWLCLIPAFFDVHAADKFREAGVDESFVCDPYIAMKTAQGSIQPGWLASQADMLSNDWIEAYHI